jgi:hypothetical protein
METKTLLYFKDVLDHFDWSSWQLDGNILICEKSGLQVSENDRQLIYQDALESLSIADKCRRCAANAKKDEILTFFGIEDDGVSSKGQLLFQNRERVLGRLEEFYEKVITPRQREYQEAYAKKKAIEHAEFMQRQAEWCQKQKEAEKKEKERKDAFVDARAALTEILNGLEEGAYKETRALIAKMDTLENEDLVASLITNIPQPIFVRLRKIAYSRRIRFHAMIAEALTMYATLFADVEQECPFTFSLTESEKKNFSFAGIFQSLKAANKNTKNQPSRAINPDV